MFRLNHRFTQVRKFSSSTPEGQQLKRTALYEYHRERRAKFVDFCGWEMPVTYGNMGVLQSHLHTRSEASLFDVSHMCQLRFWGKDRIKFLESLVVADLEILPVGSATLSLITNAQGGIKDDTVITNKGDHIYMVVNAGCADKDLAHFEEQLNKFNGDVKMEHFYKDNSLVALQGPAAAPVLSRFVGPLNNMGFMTSQEMKIDGIDCIVSRCGYTGEDGFEISTATSNIDALARLLSNNDEVYPAGLGARDSLRLEAGLCLYGKRRRAEGNFLGSDVILKQIEEGVTRKRVGLVVDGPPARDHTKVFDENKNEIGEITSGTMSPCLKKPVAMAYINLPFNKLRSEVLVQVRNKFYPAIVTKMPFVPTNYHK